jgi:protease secretion system outer membrane protein
MQAWTAYLPSASYNQQRLVTDPGPRRTTTVTQPLIDAARGAAFLQGSARESYADATFLVKDQDLAQRTLKAANQLLLAKEAIKANDSRVLAFEAQYKGAKRKFDLGEGTVTDMRDIEVKYKQAQADQLTLTANLKVAEMQFTAITGEAAGPADFTLSTEIRDFGLEPLDHINSSLNEKNPQILSARANERITRLDAHRAAGASLPTLSAQYQTTTVGGSTIRNSGVVFNIPLDAGNFSASYSAYAKADQAITQRMDTEEKARIEAARLFQVVEAGQESLKIKKSAIESAELSVDANQKSYKAGVRTTIDVLNSIQVLYQAKNDYVHAIVQQTEDLSNLLLITGEDTTVVIGKLQAFLYR